MHASTVREEGQPVTLHVLGMVLVHLSSQLQEGLNAAGCLVRGELPMATGGEAKQERPLP